MLALYLTCLLFGGILLAISLFAGGDVDAELEVAGGDVDVSVDAEVDIDAVGQGIAAAARFLSFRDIVFFAAFFGLAGTLFTALRVNAAVTAGTSLVVGLAAGTAVHRLISFLRESESGEAVSLDRLEGVLAEVVVDIAGSKAGKIAVKSGDRTHQLVATVHEAAEQAAFRSGETVLVVQVENGIARVVESTFLG